MMRHLVPTVIASVLAAFALTIIPTGSTYGFAGSITSAIIFAALTMAAGLYFADILVAAAIGIFAFVSASTAAVGLIAVFGFSGRNWFVLGKLWHRVKQTIGVLAVLVGWCSYCFDLSFWWAVFLGFCTVGGGLALVAIAWLFQLVVVRLLILPASMAPSMAKHVMPEFDFDAARDAGIEEHGWESVEVTTADGLALDVYMHIDHRQLDLKAADQTWVVQFLGNGAHYEMILDDAVEVGHTLGRNSLVFNLRGVGRSEGLPIVERDLLADGRACLQYLHQGGVPSKNILLMGHSLGGAIATLLHAEPSFQGHLVNDRSFSSLPAVPLALFHNPKVASMVPAFVSRKVQRYLPLVMRTIGWEMDVFQTWLAAGSEKHRRTLIVYHRQDDIIDFEHASLFEAVDAWNAVHSCGRGGSGGLPCVCIEMLKSQCQSPHNLPLTHDPQWKAVIVGAIFEMLAAK